MSDRVEKAVAPLYGKLLPKDIESTIKPHAMEILKSKHFSSEADRLKTFSDYIAGLMKHPDNKHIATGPGPAVTGGAGYTPGELARNLGAPGSRFDQLTNGSLSKRLAG